MQFLQTATNDRNVKGSNRVLRCDATDEEYPIGEIVSALVTKFGVKKATARVKLNNAAKNGGEAFGHKWSLVSGTPYGEGKPRQLQSVKKKTNKSPVKRAA